ncbi:transcriptional regulator [Clostridium baratii]|uniref:MerR family transcriptional regulator n=2 Tax=Clostridium TaxID=1485 RepID=A0ABP3WZT9_9CLOT|nr:MerR family transcriptional regulator [Clostridium baratii]OPF51165.1 transcriptional regulator [Clostridium baratii]OPF55758.1 transcriptional regulator [Clostridium baratii]OPF56862.1 transcriptional regulator [Clostridium baratii]OPF59861.1 transcriptional regulator [Clostridium baratii]CUP86912.1 transcriptional regulator%2C MerR family [Clostridium baratii]
MTIKEAAELTGVSIDNLRYYERIGLIPKVPRTSSGIRDYDEISIRWIEFVIKFKKAGASIESIREYIRLAEIGESTKQERRQILIEIKKNIEMRMKELQECLDITNYKINNYYNICEPVTKELVNDWKNRENKKEG